MRKLLSTRVGDMPTPTEDPRAFLRWLAKSKGMEICRRSFGEWRPERFPERLVDEWEATRTDRPAVDAPIESRAPVSSPTG